MRLVIKNTFFEASDEDSDAEQPTVKRVRTDCLGLRRLLSRQTGVDAEQEEDGEEGEGSDAPHRARTVPPVVQHQPVEATTIAAAVGACSAQTEADEELATSRA